MTKLNIHVDHFIVEEHDGYDIFDTTLSEASLTIDPYNNTETTSFEVKEGDTIHVLYAVWSAGDSMTEDKNNMSEIIEIYSTAAKASAAFKRLIEGKKTFVLESGTTFSYGDNLPWGGWFDHLSGIYIEERIVKA